MYRTLTGQRPMEPKQKILAVVGPTAGGKSELALALASELRGEIVSCDSMQIYRGMNIGTAKPTEAERRAAPHHLIDVLPPDADFSCADYLSMAKIAVEETLGRGNLPIFCGGTGLYLDAFLRGGLPEDTVSDPEIRAKWVDYAAQNGAHALHAELERVDPESAAAIHENNIKRVVRALEICEITGVTKSERDRQTQHFDPPYDALVIGLRYSDRNILADRIARRVDRMLDAGLVEETRRLDDADVFRANATAAQAIGYKELLPFLHGEESLDVAREKIILATKHYAKRQMTWFSAKDYVRWIDADRGGSLRPFDEIFREACDLWREFARS